MITGTASSANARVRRLWREGQKALAVPTRLQTEGDEFESLGTPSKSQRFEPQIVFDSICCRSTTQHSLTHFDRYDRRLTERFVTFTKDFP
jgi:hypothetical protein